MTYDGATSTATVFGVAPDQTTREKIVLCCGNVAGVAAVKDMMTVDQSAAEAQWYTVASGDTLSKISRQLLRRRQQVHEDLRGQQADADLARQDLPRPEAAHPAAMNAWRSRSHHDCRGGARAAGPGDDDDDDDELPIGEPPDEDEDDDWDEDDDEEPWQVRRAR